DRSAGPQRRGLLRSMPSLLTAQRVGVSSRPTNSSTGPAFCPAMGRLVTSTLCRIAARLECVSQSHEETAVRKYLLLAGLWSGLATGAQTSETLAGRSQAKARNVVDAAVTAIGGAEALRGIETLELRLQGETWPRLQMPTPTPPFEAGTFDESLVLDLKDNRLYLEQHFTGAGFEGHNTVVIKEGKGTPYTH